MRLQLVGLADWIDHYPRIVSVAACNKGLAWPERWPPMWIFCSWMRPFSALDPLIRRQMQDELIRLQDRLHKTIIFITHDLNEALRVGNHVAIMRDGAIVQIGTPIEIITQPADEYVARFMADVDQSRVLTAEFVMRPAHHLTHQIHCQRRACDRWIPINVDALYVVDEQGMPDGVVRRSYLHRLQADGKIKFARGDDW